MCELAHFLSLIDIISRYRRYVPDNRVQFTKGSYPELSSYTFNKRRTDFLFCPTCGCGLFAKADFVKTVVVNVRSAEGLDLDGLGLKLLNGASV